ncbi:MAG TPA: tyrosine-type recombinase/integrase, partial [Polyangia bacterium]|nr:tyrosine-type recombinase/integrase [Polyangia bacterium]
LNHDTGEHLSDRWMNRWFRAAVELAGLDDKVAPGDGRLRIHDLRHTHASLADARGASATAIRDALGHSNLAVTQRYLHRHQARGALELARLMDPGASKEAV